MIRMGNLLGWLMLVLSVASYGQGRTVGLIYSDTRVAPGYVLFTALGGGVSYLIDTEGRLVHSWNSERQVQMAYLHESGNLYRVVRLNTPSIFNQGNPGAGRIECVSWDGDVLWYFDYRSDDYTIHHDIALAPNGNVFFIAWEYINREDAIYAGFEPSAVESGIWPDKIIEISHDGNGGASIVWEWRTWDHLVQNRSPFLDNYGVPSRFPGRIDVNAPVTKEPSLVPEDWQHSNGLDYNPTLDQLVLSGRHTNEIWIIDHSITTEEARGEAGDILYRWGNPAMYGRTGAQQLYNQHDAQWIKEGYPGAGNILIFNNGTNTPELNRAYSTIDEIVPPLQPDGTYVLETDLPFQPEAPVWRYETNPRKDFYSRVVSGAERMPNGNTIISAGIFGEIFEVTFEGETVWKYINPVTRNGILTQGDSAANNTIFKARKYSPDYLAFAGKDLTPGDPIELIPSSIDEPASISASLSIQSVYPNPFSSVSSVVIHAKQRKYVHLSVYDINGKEIAVLADGNMNALSNTYTWNGKSSNGEPTPAGMYHLVMRTASGTDVRQIVKF